MEQGKLVGAGVLSACIIAPALVVSPSLAVICATLAIECVLGAILAGRV